MRPLEKWIWLNTDIYGDFQTTVYHPTNHNINTKGNYTVAEFTKTYTFDKKVTSLELRFSGDTAYDLWLNDAFLANGPVNVGGDYAFNERCHDRHYATTVTLQPDSRYLTFLPV